MYYFEKSDTLYNTHRYSICKQVSGADLSSVEEEDLWDSILVIEPDISPDHRVFLSDCLAAVKNTPVRSWTDLDVSVHSQKLGLHGLLDKYDSLSGDCTLVRCRSAPPEGVWYEDRIRIAALLLCIEETMHIRPDGIYVEYIPSGIVRYYNPSPRDRRILLQTIHKIHSVEKGIFPARPANPPCKSCPHQGRCDACNVKKVSSFFKKG